MSNSSFRSLAVLIEDSLDSAMSVPRSEIEKIKKLRNSSVVLPDGGYMASIGGFHQMHCLNVLRKASYLEYYVVHEPDFFAQPTVRKHIGRLTPR